MIFKQVVKILKNSTIAFTVGLFVFTSCSEAEDVQLIEGNQRVLPIAGERDVEYRMGACQHRKQNASTPTQSLACVENTSR